MTRIIVADDDRVTSHLMCAKLRRHGYAREAALDVPALFRLCAAPPAPQVILLDLHMSGGSALHSIRRLVDDPTLSGTPLILMSGSSNSPEEQDGQLLCAVAFLLKPIDPTRLVDTIDAALRARGIH